MAIDIKTPDDLYNREAFEQCVKFHPHHERQLGHILAAYHFTKENEIPCGISSCRQKHQKGYLVTTSDGLETNIGNHCGKTHLGEDFTYKARAFNAEQKRLSRLNSLTELQQKTQPIRAAVDELVPRASRLYQLRKAIRINCPALDKKLIERSKTGKTEIIGYVRMSEDEAHREFFRKAKEDEKFEHWFQKNIPMKQVVKAHIQGLSFFSVDLNKILQQALVQPLSNIEKLDLESAEQIDEKRLQELSNWASQYNILLEKARSAIETGEVFFTKANIQGLRDLWRELTPQERPSLEEALQSILEALSPLGA